MAERRNAKSSCTMLRHLQKQEFKILARIIHGLVGWDKETAIWWAGACELTFHFDWMLCWVRLPFPPAHHGLTLAGPTLRESSGLDLNPKQIRMTEIEMTQTGGRRVVSRRRMSTAVLNIPTFEF